jgi:hypothetical protein
MAKLSQDEREFLAALSATNPIARQLVDKLMVRRGRPRKTEFQYRRLEAWWNPFWELQKKNGLTKKQAIAKFWRARGNEIEKLIGVKLNKPDSRRKAISRGKRESERVQSRRVLQIAPRIVPAGLVQKILKGTDWHIATNVNEAILIRAAQHHALLGK